jgi:phage-related holin
MLGNYLTTVKSSVVNACTSDILLKCISVFFVIAANIAFGGVEKILLVGVGMLTIFDLFTALIREFHLGRSIKSSKLIKTPVKLTVYGIMISASYITESVIMVKGITLPVTQIIATVIAITEFVSILENAGDMGYAIPKKLLNRLKSISDGE